MSKNTFWNDASRCGAIVGVVHVVFAFLGLQFQSMALLISLVALVAQIWLLARYTGQRAALFSQEGFSYSQSLGFIAAMSIFAGIVSGAYEIIASNFLFTEVYQTNLNNIIAIYAQMGTFDNAALESMSNLYRSMLFSPVPILLTQIFSVVLTFGFYGLFISIGTKREPDIFERPNNDVVGVAVISKLEDPEQKPEENSDSEQKPGQKQDSELK